MEDLGKHARLLSLILLLLVAGLAFQVNGLRLNTHKLMAREISRNIGMGDSLKVIVETLEANLAERATYEPEAIRDPLALRRVVRMPLKSPTSEEARESGRMRLSATLLSPGNFTAIIKYQGRSYNLAVGDSLDRHEVQSIDKRTVVLSYLGQSLVLVNEPAPKAEVQAEGNHRAATVGRLEDLEL